MAKWVSENAPITSAGGLKISQAYPCSTSNYANQIGRTVKYIVMHYTGNASDTASANARYFQRRGIGASAHYFVDENSIYQSVGVKNRAWHCGARSYWHKDCRNQNAIGIEMCCNGGYKMGEKTIENAAQLCASLCKYIGISASQVDTYVLRHYDVSGKQCPAPMAGAGNSAWTQFKNRVKEILAGNQQKQATSSSASSGYTPNMPVVKIGSRGSVAKNLQFILNGLGYNCGVADGIFGNATKNALVKFQKDHGLVADGICGNATWKCLLAYPIPTLSVGSKGYAVKVLQSLLVGYGFKTAIDGVFGNGTKEKLIAYQKSRKLTADGVAGPKTLAMILS